MSYRSLSDSIGIACLNLRYSVRMGRQDIAKVKEKQPPSKRVTRFKDEEEREKSGTSHYLIQFVCCAMCDCVFSLPLRLCWCVLV